MEPDQVRTSQDLRTLINERDVDHVTVALSDLQGLLRGKYMARDKFLGALDHGFGMPPVIFVLDPTDVIMEIPRWSDETARFHDGVVKIIPETLREIPWEPAHRNLFVLVGLTGDDDVICPRALYERVAKKAADMGFRPFHACELEYTLFDETAMSAYKKGYKNLELTTPHRGYSVLQRQEARSDFYADLMDTMRHMRVPLEAVHEEIGVASQLETSLQYSEGITAADNAVIFKTFAKAVAQRRGQLLSFMARWTHEADGQSGHLHMSLRDLEGQPVFHDPSKEGGMSDTMLYFIGGLQKLLPELLLMLAPNVNSFKRFVPDIFAPTSVFWGRENRTVALRAITGSAKSQRVECRVPGADANPYLSLAGTLAAGLYGIEHRIEPAAEMTENAYAQKVPAKLRLPETFRDGIERYNKSKFAREWFGDPFVDLYVAGRAQQEQEFRSMVTAPELERFLELS